MNAQYTDLFQEEESNKPSKSGKRRRHGARQEVRIGLEEVPIPKNVWKLIDGV